MHRSKWLTLTILALAQFVVVLDLTIVNVALPSVQRDLGFSAGDLQWIVNAYTLLFGGLLLLGGRAADLLGRRAVFMAGLAVFTAASLVAGLAGSPAVMVAARAVQGLGGAFLSPAAFSLLQVAFSHGRERNVAMGVWGALAGLGGTLGVVAGGILIDALSWRWVFFVNVPIGAALVLLAPALIAESRSERGRRDTGRSIDIAGAVLGTAGLLAVVLGVVRTQALGWGSAEVIGLLLAGSALLVAFVAVEARAAAPLVPLRLFRTRSLTVSSLALALNGATFLSMFFLTAIFLQSVRGLSALATGLELLPMGIAAIAAAITAGQLVTRIGTRPVQIAGAALSAAGLLLLTGASASGGYAESLLPGFVVFGLGIVAIGVPNQISAVAEVAPHDAGSASGVVTAAYQIGGALGLAVITTLSSSHVTHLVAGGAGRAEALTGGYQLGMLLAAGLALGNLLLAFAAPRITPDAELAAAALAGA